jgi:phage terminase small subunit
MTNLRYPEDVNPADWTDLKAFCTSRDVCYGGQRSWVARNKADVSATFVTACMRSNGRPDRSPKIYIRTSALPELLDHINTGIGSGRIRLPGSSANGNEVRETTNLRYPEDVNPADWTELQGFCKTGGVDYTGQYKWLMLHMKDIVAKFATIIPARGGSTRRANVCYIRTSALPKLLAHIDASRIKSPEGSANVKEAQAAAPTVEQQIAQLSQHIALRDQQIAQQIAQQNNNFSTVLSLMAGLELTNKGLAAAINKISAPEPAKALPAPEPAKALPAPEPKVLPAPAPVRPVRKVKNNPAEDIEYIRDRVLTYSHIVDAKSPERKYQRAVAMLFNRMDLQHSGRKLILKAQEAGYGADPLAWLPKSGLLKLAISCATSMNTP